MGVVSYNVGLAKKPGRKLKFMSPERYDRGDVSIKPSLKYRYSFLLNNKKIRDDWIKRTLKFGRKK